MTQDWPIDWKIGYGKPIGILAKMTGDETMKLYPSMNKRIEDLMYRAGLTAQGCWDELDDYDRNAIETFAQLIVKECAGVAHGSDQPSKDIKEHFGVKE